jgi:hypothetical protein
MCDCGVDDAVGIVGSPFCLQFRILFAGLVTAVLLLPTAPRHILR